MATIKENEILWVPGTLIEESSNAVPPNYGGVILGSGRKFQLDLALGYDENYAVEYAQAIRMFLIHGNPIVQFKLRQWTAAGLASFFPSAGGGSVTVPGTANTGQEITPKNYLWAADRATDPSVWVNNAIPMVEANSEALMFSEEQELNVWVTFKCLPKDSGDLVVIAPMSP